VSDLLLGILERSRNLGFLGPGEVDTHRQHAASFVDAWATVADAPPPSLLDLGAGGGVPGLVLAEAWPDSRVVLLDAGERRCAFLREAVAELGFAARCEVAEGRAEVLARNEALSPFPLVVARSFGSPAATAECAARFLAPGGTLLVAEPPDPEATRLRWPAEGLAQLGLGPAAVVGGHARLVRITAERSTPARFPRRDGTPAKRPLF
jgi:16S rRNA (guanine527-N7)-methyltransferase